MSNSLTQPAIIFINNDLVDQVIGVFTTQLFLSQVLTAAQFDGYVMADGYYATKIHQQNQRIMVLRDLQDYTNRNLADIVLFAKSGLVSVLYTKFGPPANTFSIDKLTMIKLFGKIVNPTQLVPCFDYDPTHIFPAPIPEPSD